MARSQRGRSTPLATFRWPRTKDPRRTGGASAPERSSRVYIGKRAILHAPSRALLSATCRAPRTRASSPLRERGRAQPWRSPQAGQAGQALLAVDLPLCICKAAESARLDPALWARHRSPAVALARPKARSAPMSPVRSRRSSWSRRVRPCRSSRRRGPSGAIGFAEAPFRP